MRGSRVLTTATADDAPPQSVERTSNPIGAFAVAGGALKFLAKHPAGKGANWFEIVAGSSSLDFQGVVDNALQL